jgi:hypothetical protein
MRRVTKARISGALALNHAMAHERTREVAVLFPPRGVFGDSQVVHFETPAAN